MSPPNNKNVVQATVSPRSIGGTSLFRHEGTINEGNVDAFRSECDVMNNAVRELRSIGFEVFEPAEDDTTISIRGSRKLFEDTFNKKLKRKKKEISAERKESYFALPGKGPDQLVEPPSRLQGLIEGVALAEPAILFGTAVSTGEPPAEVTVPDHLEAEAGNGAATLAGGVEAFLPPLAPIPSGGYRYLFAPDEIAVLLRAARVHRLGTTGRGIRVAMIDSGHYRHPFFIEHGYRVAPTVLGPGASNPKSDSNGHGTGESANVFSSAPDASLLPVKMAGDTVGAFNAAVALKPHVITNSWGYHIDFPGVTLSPYLKALEAAVANAVSKGIVVCFSGGNGHRAFPACHPDVIAVGGVHVNYPSLTFEASNYASSFDSNLYPGRHVPDVCGLVGNTPPSGAPSIMLPVESGASLDFPNTGSSTDGWGLFSGTSASCPQIAGVVALLLQKKKLAPKKVKDILMKWARDVTTGQSAMGDPAGPGPDKATGAGLVDAKWSYITAYGFAVSDFMAAPAEEQAEMLASKQMEPITEEGFEEMIETLRSR